MADSQQRQVAYKVQVKDILDGEFIKQEGWNPSYIKNQGKEISRVNIISTIVTTDDNQILVDDGTGRITLRVFENQEIFSGLNIGDIILIIGKVREFNERYIIPEIIKKIKDSRWVQVRKIELEKESRKEPKKEPRKEPEQPEPITEEVEDLSDSSPTDLIYQLIKEIDDGQGATIDDVIEKSNNENAEKIINNLLTEGEIFEISPGKVKVLE